MNSTFSTESIKGSKIYVSILSSEMEFRFENYFVDCNLQFGTHYSKKVRTAHIVRMK